MAFFLSRALRLDDIQWDGHIQNRIRNVQHNKPRPERECRITGSKKSCKSIEANCKSNPPINDGPISLSSTVLNPFSPVPTNAITKPIAMVPKPTYRKALANELGPLSTPSRSSSSEEPPNDESCIWKAAKNGCKKRVIWCCVICGRPAGPDAHLLDSV